MTLPYVLAVLLSVILAGCSAKEARQEARDIHEETQQWERDNAGTTDAIRHMDRAFTGIPGPDAPPAARAFYAQQKAAADAYTRRNQAAAASWQRQQQKTKGEAQ